MKTRLSLLMVLALLAALSATSVTRADGPVTGGGTGAGGWQTSALPSILPVSRPGQPADDVVAIQGRDRNGLNLIEPELAGEELIFFTDGFKSVLSEVDQVHLVDG